MAGIRRFAQQSHSLAVLRLTTDQEEQAENRVVLQDTDVRNRSRNGDIGTFLGVGH